VCGSIPDACGIRADSRGILRHISHKYAEQGNPYLIGTGALERASIEQWLQTEAQSFDAPSAEMVFSLAFLPPPLPKQNDNGREVAVVNTKQGPGTASTAQKEEEMLKLFEQRKKDLEKLLDIYEQRLEEAEYLAGDNFTIADLSHLPNADRLASDPRSRRLFESRKNVSKWWYNISNRDPWQYVKSLQGPPPTEANNGEQGGNNSQQ
jgi:glutathione S-transferase